MFCFGLADLVTDIIILVVLFKDNHRWWCSLMVLFTLAPYFVSYAVLGFGGAGKAILSFLIEHSHKENNFYLFNRTKPSKVSSNIEFKLLNADNLGEKIQSIDLLINTTSVGSNLSIKQSPVPIELICKIKKSAIVYDIIYDPKYTELLERANKLGLKIINGLRMNMIQAVLAYRYTNDTALSKKDILQIMS